jgi:hypothetical protein
MSDEAAKTLATAFVTGCALIMIGLMMSKPPRLNTFEIGRGLEKIAESAPHAACIGQGKRWRSYGCTDK